MKMREIINLVEAATTSANRIEPVGENFRVVVDNQDYGTITRRDDGWVVTDVPTNSRATKGSRHPYPSPRKAFLAYFGNSRTYSPWISELAKQLPSTPVEYEPSAEPEVDLDALMAQGDAAHDEAARLDTQLRQMFARVKTV